MKAKGDAGKREGEGSRPPRARIPRGQFVGTRVDRAVVEEREHFMQCPGCGAWFDMRDLGQVFDHDGPLPHPGADA